MDVILLSDVMFVCVGYVFCHWMASGIFLFEGSMVKGDLIFPEIMGFGFAYSYRQSLVSIYISVWSVCLRMRYGKVSFDMSIAQFSSLANDTVQENLDQPFKLVKLLCQALELWLILGQFTR